MLSWRILWRGEDVTARFSGFTISAGLDAFVRELTLSVASPQTLPGHDWTRLPRTPEIEVLTLADGAWTSQGRYYLERPEYRHEAGFSVLSSAWGRSAPAALERPLGHPVYDAWDRDMAASGILSEVCGRCGLASRLEVPDWRVPAGSLSGGGRYPVEVLRELAGLAGAALSCDREGAVVIRAVDHAPGAPALTLTDAVIASATERLEQPDYADRVRVTPAGAASGWRVDIVAPDQCLIQGGPALTLHARVTDAEGRAVNGAPVSWTLAGDAAVPDGPLETSTDLLPYHTETLRVSRFAVLKTAFPAREILSVRRVRSAVSEEYAPGADVSESEVTLSRPLPHCDSEVRVTYSVDGVAVLRLRGQGRGVVDVRAECRGTLASAEVYVDLPCQCPVSIGLELADTALKPGSAVEMLVSAEQSGQALDGALVRMRVVEGGDVAALRWTSAELGPTLTTERATVRNASTDGPSEVELKRPAEVVVRAAPVARDEATDLDLYADHEGRSVSLSDRLDDGTEVEVQYWAAGSVANSLSVANSAAADGRQVRVEAWMDTAREEPVSVQATASVRAEERSTDGSAASSASTDPRNEGYSSRHCSADSASNDPACPRNLQSQCSTSDDWVFNLDRLSFCGGRDFGGYAANAAATSLFRVVADGAGKPVLALNAVIAVTDGSRSGGLRFRLDEASGNYYPGGAFLAPGDGQ